ncbi:hypothetical protein ER308_20965 [Egibacter rhizosphaerae]|uniref:DNA helicase n=1 Tax=Egibacter rhizosphaerae TaxID=1670831 RepID=A0A411YKS5_9ACTN|nr:cory-CC-star protein [Egibacter rhizosphaerae]QBI21783.1 hypothetical protein ER308_20965 [Egibacter rhizosphaerae]
MISALRRAAGHYEQVYTVRYRSALEREARRQEDLLVTLLFLEALGVENPASPVTAELLPEMIAAYHDWHRREGWERAPDPGVCC